VSNTLKEREEKAVLGCLAAWLACDSNCPLSIQGSTTARCLVGRCIGTLCVALCTNGVEGLAGKGDQRPDMRRIMMPPLLSPAIVFFSFLR